MSDLIVILSVPSAIAFVAITFVLVAGATASPAPSLPHHGELVSDAREL